MNKRMCVMTCSLGLLGCVSIGPVAAQEIDGSVRQQEAARADAELRQRANQPMAGVFFAPKTEAERELPVEETMFPVQHIEIRSQAKAFHKFRHVLDRYEGRSMGSEGIGILERELQEAVLSDGYITSRVVVPNQDISSGTLFFEIIPGYIEAVELTQPARSNWRSAFPVRKGDILRRQQLEQGIDQMRSVPGQDVVMHIEPGSKPNFSVIKLTVEQKGYVHGSLSVDNFGYESTGKVQGTAQVSVSQLTGLNDTFSASYMRDLEHKDDEYGSKQYAFSYSVPDGNRTYRVSMYKYNYHQTILAPNPYVSSGSTRGQELSVEQLLNRTSRSKTSIGVKLIRKERHSFINDTEIGVQEQRTTAVEAGLYHRYYKGNAVFDLYAFYRQGVPWMGAKEQWWEGQGDNPTTRYKMAGLEGQIQAGVRIGHKQGIYTMRFRSQFTNQRLFGTEQFSIGGRYSVRGFSGEETLRGESGFYIQNEWALPFKRQHITPYIGVDIGHVWGPSTGLQLGSTLIGGAIGVRGTVGKGLFYDVSFGTPIKKPDGFKTDTRVWALRATYSF